MLAMRPAQGWLAVLATAAVSALASEARGQCGPVVVYRDPYYCPPPVVVYDAPRYTYVRRAPVVYYDTPRYYSRRSSGFSFSFSYRDRPRHSHHHRRSCHRY
jgi:hypothetical protein